MAASLEGTAGVVSTEEEKGGKSQLDTYLRLHIVSDSLPHGSPTTPQDFLYSRPPTPSFSPPSGTWLLLAMAHPLCSSSPQIVPLADVTSLRPHEDLWRWGAVPAGEQVWSKNEIEVCPNPRNLVLRLAGVAPAPGLHSLYGPYLCHPEGVM